ncbi:cobalt transport protein CorA [Geotalea daltonii FRC-32]|uniref:Magnesium transport protein CorA n=1 Tax=Geotalea daltonii (strain DSM 22248 / JCM 15807 / FRC-32) TaxID=316067 RepID=B9M084_GEODF|nr:magnesium/cobalt transporter CorA [Geotalea daltonii]ACM20864.1 cobalt transport protein CorA [Geotalea daltonii FRC-32]
MAKHIKRSIKSGLPPGTLVHIGAKSDREIRITVMDYHAGGCEEKEIKALKECVYYSDTSIVSWIDVEGLHEVEIVRQVGDCQGLHPLVLEDILNTNQRPKVEDYGDYLYIVLKMLHNGDGTGIVAEQVSLVLGSNFVISFQEGMKGDVFNPIRERLRSGKGKIREMGADYLAYALMDAVVDNYFVVLERVGERIEELEDAVMADPRPETVREIHQLKREVILLRKAVWPLREVISALERRESKLISEKVVVYLRDLYDHTIQVIDNIEASRDMLAGMLDVYLSSISNRMNEVMKFLTIIGTIFIPLTFIAGVYGMNFQNMPELHWQWGYFACLFLMALVAVFLLIYFKRKRWL